MAEYTVEQLLDVVNSSYSKPGDERVRKIAERLIGDFYKTIVDFDVTHEEMWAFFKWLNSLGKANQSGLLAAGIGIERLLDILADEKDIKEGRPVGSTARAIEGPLYVPGAPLEKRFARMDDGSEYDKAEPLVMEGHVYDVDGKPISGAVVDAWHANLQGTYSIIDPTQTPYNNRRRIETDEKGYYGFRSFVPPGYWVPEESPTQVVLDLLGRHGNRPAHIHFMVSGPGLEELTTQINIPGDKYLHDDFAFATRDALVVEMIKITDPKEIEKYGMGRPFTKITFDFKLQKAKK